MSSHEFDLLTHTMAKIDAVLATHPRAKAVVERVYEDEPETCRYCEDGPRYRDDSAYCLECDIMGMEYDRERNEDR